MERTVEKKVDSISVESLTLRNLLRLHLKDNLSSEQVKARLLEFCIFACKLVQVSESVVDVSQPSIKFKKKKNKKKNQKKPQTPPPPPPTTKTWRPVWQKYDNIAKEY